MIAFDLNKTIEILERTPIVVDKMLTGLSVEWVMNNEGENTWSPFDITGHLIEGEKKDWIPRIEIILSDKEDKKFAPFDPYAHLNINHGRSLDDLLSEFKKIRIENIETLKLKKITEKDLARTGIHPEFGIVTLKQHLSTWAAHDLAHISQIARVMAKQYKTAIGPWTKYLSIMNK
jgi:hypothetical protein